MFSLPQEGFSWCWSRRRCRQRAFWLALGQNGISFTKSVDYISGELIPLQMRQTWLLSAFWSSLLPRRTRSWLTTLQAWFFVLIPLYSFSLFLPTIIKSLGFTATKAQLLTVPPNFTAFLLVLLTTYYSDKLKMRGPIMLVGQVLAIIGYIMLLVSKRPNVKYGGTFFVASGVFICSPAVMAWLSNNLSPHYVRATGTGFQVAFANCEFMRGKCPMS